ncbi:MAG: SpoIIE family protein phosphatase [Candidatus Poribacteria bacterium]|nr:SpoIIE family protein phosphatase [Candidatus Poribacteria bacterium]
MNLSSAEETIQRLIFSLSELEQLGQTLISGHSNFNVSSKTYLRITLGTLQATRGAIFCFHPTDNYLTIAASTPEVEIPPIEIEPDEVASLLECTLIELDTPPKDLQNFINRNSERLNGSAAHRLWVPLKIHEEFLGILSLGKFLGRTTLEDWEQELLTILAHQISIAIAYSRIVEGIQSEKFRLFMLAESAPQICQLLQPEDAAEQVVHQAVALLDANVGGLMLIHPEQQNLELRYAFPETLISENGDQDEKNPISISLKDVETDTTEANEKTEFDMLAGVVKEGMTDRCAFKTETFFGGKNLMAGPIQGRDGDILGVLVVGDKEERGGRIAEFTDEDEILLDSFAKQAGVAIENAHLHQEALEARELQAEMEEARKIQENLIPETLPEIPGYEVAGHYEPRGPVGGDYYDCIELSTGGWGLAIADVSGKGMQAALLMATLRAGLLSELTSSKVREESDSIDMKNELVEMAMTLNSLLYVSGTEEKYATFFYSHLNPETDTLTTLNGGHNPPLIVKNDGNIVWMGQDVGGLPLGMFPNDMVPLIAKYEAEQIKLESGDLIIFYTDGVTETVNTEDEFYDEERLEEVAKTSTDSDASHICNLIYQAVMDFQGDADQFDDLTLLVLRKK